MASSGEINILTGFAVFQDFVCKNCEGQSENLLNKGIF